MFDNPRGVGKD